MSITAPDLTRIRRPDPDHAGHDELVVTCSACGERQHASGRALGYTCRSCGSDWRVMRCQGCRSASVVLAGVSACPRCGHDHRVRPRAVTPRQPSWLTEPDPLSVWIGGVKYLGGHAERDQPVSSGGLLLDRRGVHLRAFAELLSIRWDTVRGIDIEGPQDISERLTLARLRSLGATTWALQVAYLTVHTTNGDAIFEVNGLAPPELHARLSPRAPGPAKGRARISAHRDRTPRPGDRPGPRRPRAADHRPRAQRRAARDPGHRRALEAAPACARSGSSTRPRSRPSVPSCSPGWRRPRATLAPRAVRSFTSRPCVNAWAWTPWAAGR